MHLASGTALFRQGDTGEHVYVVVNGRLRVAGVDGDGRERTLEEVGRGGAVGEVALLTGEPRSASVYAVRDSYLLRLSRAAFDELLPLQPRAMMQIARAGVWRLRRAAQRQASRGSSPAVYAVVAAGADVELAGFARRLAESSARSAALRGCRRPTSIGSSRGRGSPAAARTRSPTNRSPRGWARRSATTARWCWRPTRSGPHGRAAASGWPTAC